MYGSCRGSCIKPWILNHDIPGLNSLVAVVVPMGKALYIHCLVPQIGLQAIGLLIVLS